MATLTYKKEKWSLDELFPAIDSQALTQALDKVEGLAASFEANRESLAPGMASDEFMSILKSYEELLALMQKIEYFAFLLFSEDTQNQKAQSFMARMQQAAAELENRTLFFILWWKALEDDQADRLAAEAGDLRYWLEFLRLTKDYTLSEPEEKVINLKDVNGAAAMITLYDSITNRYTFELEVDGETKELTRGELMVYVRRPDPAIRAAAYQAQLTVFSQDQPILGQIYQALMRDWRSENIDLRRHESPISVRNLGNNLPDVVVDTLLEVCRKNARLFHRYFKLKARWLGIEKLRRYDIYAPVTASEKTYKFEEAVRLTLDSFGQFDPNISELAKRVFDEHHLDSEVRKGKRSGAFCATVTPDLTPWVLTSFQGRPDDVATMAHELGHAVHALLASHHSLLTQQASLPLAETASTFGEILLVDRMMASDPDPGLQRDLLFRQMDDAYATIMRQAFFALFERQAHELIHGGCSVDDLSAAYFENLQEQFGDSLELSEDFKHEWVAIPHIFHTPFYVYAYAFGQLLVFALYQQFRQEGERFKPRYLRLLASGGSDSPERILTAAGIDMRSAEFWEGGFRIVSESLDKLERLEVPSRAG
ncbi:MAG TPA: M3 family oligoendopeptidase [Anaerolineales bacterium]|nr:M3 family oligoendopeptidase [Anaerolineales bacterium]